MKISISKNSPIFFFFFFFFFILVGNGVVGYTVYKSNQKLRDAEQWVQHTEQVIYKSGEILSLAKDLETASRGFVITNDSVFLEPLYVAQKTTFVYIGELTQLVKDNPEQQKRVDSLNFYMHKRLDFSLQSVELRSKKGLTSATAYVSTKKGKHITDHLRQITNAIQQEEATLLKQRKQTNELSVATFNRVIVVLFILMMVFTILLLIAVYDILLKNKEKEKRAAELVIANKELGFQNREKEKRADELILANKELAYQNEEKEKRAEELIIANKKLVVQNKEKEKRAGELIIANKELGFQNREKEKRADELILANKELAYQNSEKEKRADELTIANKELAYQNEEKEKRATELIIANKELAFQNEEKEKRAAELVIANKELVFLNEEKEKRATELETANKDLEQFAYVASHDLQEPLRMVASYTQLLERRYKDKLDQDANDFIQYAVDGANRMQKLINDLLDYSRTTSRGKDFAKVDSSQVLGQTISNLQQLIIENNALITTEDLPELKADESQIMRVFQNLIVNAIKFKKKSEMPKIHISCEKKNEFYEFAVRDNGIGIEMQYQDKVFAIFQRLHSTKDYPGTGIGLSICKRVVERHGGKIWFESKENEGTTFYFTIKK